MPFVFLWSLIELLSKLLRFLMTMIVPETTEILIKLKDAYA